jgi:hypothetical protein
MKHKALFFAAIIFSAITVVFVRFYATPPIQEPIAQVQEEASLDTSQIENDYEEEETAEDLQQQYQKARAAVERAKQQQLKADSASAIPYLTGDPVHQVEMPNAAKSPSAEKLKDEVRDKKEALAFLDEVKIENLKEALKSSSSYTNANNNLDFIKGRFWGQANVLFNEKPQTWDVAFSLRAQVIDGVMKGRTTIKMWSNGTLFSDMGERGTIHKYREFTDGSSDGIFVQAAPTTYFQIFYLKNVDAIAGNMYRSKTADAPYVHIGKFYLDRSR